MPYFGLIINLYYFRIILLIHTPIFILQTQSKLKLWTETLSMTLFCHSLYNNNNNNNKEIGLSNYGPCLQKLSEN